MRKKIFAISIISLMLLMLSFATACSFQLPHSHQYNERVATADYLCSEATCRQKAKYYFSCDCGRKGTKTFEYGEVKSHEHIILKHDANNHWYECECGDALTATAHSGGSATCRQKAQCEVCGVGYGEVKSHEHTILKHDANNHWYECECGDALTATAHEHTQLKYDSNNHWRECICGDTTSLTAHNMFYGACRDCGFEIKLSVSNASVQAGQEVSLLITLAGSPGLAGLELTITFDEAQVTRIGMEEITCLDGLTYTVSQNLSSGCKVMWDGENASYNNGEIVRLNFAVADTATSGDVEVKISALGYDDNIEKVYFIVYNGIITIN